VSAKAIDVSNAPHQLQDLLEQVAAGTEIILMEGSTPRARLVPIEPRVRRRVPGLHAGSIITSPDFDAPLPDDLWA
jgi:antitoxin (DNA-binding transcriptional repressor) of toxin-antitoxin stability system